MRLENFVAIAEKPSVGIQVAKAFKEQRMKNGYIEVYDPELGKGYVTWALGHLFTIATSELVEESKGAEALKEGEVIVPEKFKLVPRDRIAARQFNVIKKLLEKADCVVNIGDPGREGELIVREILYMAGWKDWDRVYRLWTSLSLTPQVVRSEWKKLKKGNDFDSLYVSAVARQHADWIFGINSSVALQKKVGIRNASLGRVQTPTLAMIVNRYLEHVNFKPEVYYVVKAKHEKDGRYFVSVLKHEKNRLGKEEAEKIVKALLGVKEFTVAKVKKQRKKVPPPLLYSLTELQKDASRKYGFSLKKTLDLAQALYEKHKVLSYPRTDSRYLGEGNKKLVISVLKKLGREDLIPAVNRVGKRVFNDAKLTDHHALIPLAPPPDGLTPDEKKIYNLVYKRFIAVFMPPQELEVVEAILNASDKYTFVARGKRVIDPGWTEVYGGRGNGSEEAEKDREAEEAEQSLPELKEGDTVKVLGIRAERKQTQPPPLYTEGTIAGEMKKIGLGQSSTRAAIIETLKKRRYVKVVKGKLVPTEAGLELIREFGSCKFASPELTAEWEKVLEDIYHGRKDWNSYKQFISGIVGFTKSAVKDIFEAKISGDVFKKMTVRKTMRRRR